MKNEVLKWVIGTLTIIAIGFGGFIGRSFESRLLAQEEKQELNKTDIAVMKEILSQVNTRTYQMDDKLDQIEKDLRKK